MSRSQTKFSPLKEIINSLSYKNNFLGRAKQLSVLQNSWSEIIGQELAQQCLPETIKQKTLWISVANPAWSQQLHFYQRQLIDKVNTHFKKRIVERLYFTSGQQQGRPAEQERAEQRLPPTEQEVADKRAELSEVADKEIRGRLATLWAKAKRLFKKEQALVCKKCGQEYRGTNPQVCQTCEDDLKVAKKRMIANLLEEVPWASFESLRAELKAVGEEAFWEIKDQLRRKKYDKMIRSIFNFLDRPDQKAQEVLLRQILEYVSLRSGLTPDKINDKIIQEVLGSRKFRLLKAKGVRI